MDQRDPTDDQLEVLVDRVLQNLPPRRAPSTLEARVLAELERRAALPWWQQSFSHWPGIARAAFIALSLALSALTFVRSDPLLAGLESAHPLRQASAFIGAAAQTLASLAHAIPTQWLYGALALAATLYGLMFALGAIAYRILYLDAN